MRAAVTATVATLMAVASVPNGPGARASSDSIALNGTYTATSDGTQAQTNYSFHNEATVTSTWTIHSTCNNPLDCQGQVHSDQGWSAQIRLVGGYMWFVSRNIDHWEQCQDGTTAPGHQTFKFSADDKLAGWDYTVGPSGACGANKWLVVEMPFRLTPTG